MFVRRAPTPSIVLMAALLGLLFATAGCKADSPRDVVSQYLNAQIAGDAETAWSLLSEETQQQLSREQYTREIPDAERLREAYFGEFDYEIVDQIVDEDKAEVVVRTEGPNVVDLLEERDDPRSSRWFKIYHLDREAERGWRIELSPSLPGPLKTVSGVLLQRIYDVFDGTLDVSERMLDLMEKGLDLGDRFLEIFEEELERVHQEPLRPDRTAPTPPSMPRLPTTPPDDGKVPQAPPAEPDQPPPADSDRDAPDKSPTGWHHDKRQDPMTDQMRHVFWAGSQDVEGASADMRLEVWCSDGSARVFVQTQKTHGFKSDTFDFQHSTARLRVGDRPARSVKGRLHEQDYSLELTVEDQIVSQMLEATTGQLRVEVPTKFFGPVIGQFALDGLEALVDPRRSTCGSAP